MHKRYSISSGRVNRYGYRIDPAGIQLENYQANPILLYTHNDEIMSVGTMNDLRIVDGKLTGIPEFDTEDEIGADLDRKYRKGYMSAFSINHDPLEISDDLSLALPGQDRSTVVSTDLLEISCVNVPGDAGAVRLSLQENQTIDDIIPKLNFKKDNNSNMANEELQLSAEIVEALGLNEGASMDDAVQAINILKGQLAYQMQLSATSLIAKGIDAGVIDEDNKEVYEKLAADDYNTAKRLIDSSIAKLSKETESDKNPMIQAKLSALLNKKKGGEGKNDLNDAERFEKLSKENPKALTKLKQENPEEYEKLAMAYSQSQ